MLEPGRIFSTTSAYRYGFNGKEQDSIMGGGRGIDYNYGFRIYDARAVRFLSVDPLTKSYPWYSPYQFAGNKPIWANDLDGLEENTTTNSGITFFPILVPYHARTPGQMVQKAFANSAQTFANSRAGRFVNGAFNATAGINNLYWRHRWCRCRFRWSSCTSIFSKPGVYRNCSND